MKLHIANGLLGLLLVPFFLSSAQGDVRADRPTEPCGAHYCSAGGYVPNEAVAVSVALPILKSIYGEKQIEKEKPFKAELSGGTWLVSGTLNCAGVLDGHRSCKGGVAEIWISKDTGQVLKVIHGV